MEKPIGERVREVLLVNPAGLTVREISKLVGSPMDLVIACLRRTYGCYIVKFIPSKSGARTYNALWCCVTVPTNAVKPAEFKGAVVIDDKQADAQKRDIARRAAAKKQRAKQKLANQKIKQAAKEKPTPPEYKPQKTAWVSVPSWSSVGAST
jgi:hypothetical protein